MPLAFVRCPFCKQKLALQEYMQRVGTDLVCANPKCETNLRVSKERPLTIEVIPVEATYNADDRPESYG
jgi:hypothetical protein